MKDFGNIKQLLEKKGELRAKELKELGYSTYDINQFMSSNLLERKERGIYALPKKVEVQEELKLTDEELNTIATLSREGTYNLAKEYYYEASKKFNEILTLDSNHCYANKAMSLISTTKDDLNSAYEYLLISLKNIDNEKYIANYYLFMLILSKVLEIPSELIADLKTRAYVSFGNSENNYFKYFSRIEYNVLNDNLDKASTVVYYLLRNDRNRRKYNFDNNLMYLVLNKVNMKLHNELISQDNQIAEQENQPTIIVPEVEDTQVLNNTLLLNYLRDNDFDSARELLKENTISNQDEVIEILLSKLISLSSQETALPKKVTKVEDVTLISKKSIDQDVNNNVVTPKTATLTPGKTVKAATPALQINSDEMYQQYKDNCEACQFDEAKRSLLRYEMAIKQSGKYRNIKYHFDRLEADKEDYENNQEKFIASRELKQKIAALIVNKKYAEALDYAEELLRYNLKNPSAKITVAKLNNSLGNYEQAYNILIPLVGTCEEPEFFFQLAKSCYELGQYKDALSYCIAYNERRPSSSGAVYVLMAKCYNKMRKYSKELKALLKADEINLSRGKNIDLSETIGKAESRANRQHEFILAKINNKQNFED